jgi:succinate dehydrogenase / fumarate reductase, cytochrome b subunit
MWFLLRGNGLTVKHKKQKNLNLLTIHFPIPAIVSILHRISGIILFLWIPLLLWGLDLSLSSQQSFDDLHQFLTYPVSKFVVGCFLAAFIYHFVAGIRHLLMDIHIGESLHGSRLTSYLTFIISAVLMVGVGIWLW